MPTLRTIRTSFNGGEISPELFGRLDLDKEQAGLALCRNFIVLPHGPVQNRAGFRFVSKVKNPGSVTRIIPFSFNNNQTYAIELGAGYFRFHLLGSSLPEGEPPDFLSGVFYNPAYVFPHGGVCQYLGINYYCISLTGVSGIPPTNTAYWWPMAPGFYEVPNPYAATDLMDIHYVQSGDVLSLVHPAYPPMELRRYNLRAWILTPIGFASALAAPSRPTVVATYPVTGYAGSFKYIVTALDRYGQEESLPSPESVSVSNDLGISGNFNTISWTAVSGAGYYNIYKSGNGVFGYIGQVPAATLSFVDRNITADVTKSLPQADTAFAGSDDYPAAVGYYEQRRIFAGTNNQPQNLWMTQPGTENNLNFNVPSQASDALRVRIAALRANYIQHIVPLLDLIVLTASTEWRIYTASGDALAPATITIKAQSQNGANNVQPVVVNNAAIYAQSQGGHIREISYQWQYQGYQSRDLCLLATHLFNGHSIVDLAYSRSPYPILWAVNSAGKLLGLTYLPEQQMLAWHQHGTDGWFESICTITEQGWDVLYAIVRREVNGVMTRYVEVMDNRQFNGALADGFFVDSGITQSFAGPVTVLSGLDWLEGKTVSILADGVVQPQRLVAGGSITLAAAASKVTLGLPIDARISTVPAAVAGDAALGQGRVKAVNKLWARCVDFAGCMVGGNTGAQVPVAALAVDAAGNPALSNGEFRVNLPPGFNSDGSVVISQPQPLPLTIVDVTLELVVGG